MDPALRYFLLIQAVLVLSFALWRLSAACAGAVSQRAGARRWVILGRAFVLASLASPLLSTGLERLPLASRWLPETPLVGRLLGEADGPAGPLAADAQGPPTALPVASPRPEADVRGLLVGAWVTGALAVLALRGLQLRRLGRVLKEAVPFRRLGRLQILVHPEPLSPFAARVWDRAVVVIPAFLLTSGRWREALRHEIVHHRSGDARWALVWDALTALLWANPAVWLWRRRLGELQELACDEQLLERRCVSPAAYGGVLLEVAETLSARPALRLGACAPMATRSRVGRSALARRLDRILNHTQLRRFDMRSWTVWTLAGLVLWVATAAALAAVGPSAGPAAPALRLHANLQQLTSEKLTAYLERCGARRGVVVVMDPSTGAVLARAGGRRDDTTKKIVADDEAPFTLPFLGASTMKTLVVAAALQERVITTSEQFDTSGGTLTRDGKVYREWKEGGLGKVTPADILVKSSNLGVLQVAERLGGERLTAFLDRVGYQVARDAPTADVAFGNYSGVAVTAYQLAHAYAILVNAGHDPASGDSVVRPDVSELIRAALVRAVEEGTGQPARCKDLVVGGKTGTSMREVDGRMTGTAYFVGFAPAATPRLVVSVVIDDLGPEANGGRHAAPLFREVVEAGLPLVAETAASSR